MTMYSLPDITGQNSDFLKTNMPCYVYRSGMQFSFENSPVFADSIIVKLVDGTGTELVRDVDWTITGDDIDQTAMARAFLENPTFSGTLAKSITFTSNASLNKSVALTFQQFYQTTPGRTFDDGRPLEFTPDLLKTLMSELADLRQQVAGVYSPLAPNSAAPVLLPLDINCENSNNLVVGESITVNTVAGVNVIRLSQGAFFADTLVLKHNGVTLTSDEDYLPIVTSPLTQQSTNRSGIYQYILINSVISGPVVADYHAVGGEVQRTDVESIYQLMVSIKTFLDNGAFVTSGTIANTPAFSAFNSRLNLLEEDMRRLLSGAPTYGDSTAGMSTAKPIVALDSSFHWWTIANLYQVLGSTDIITADQFKGRVYIPGAKVSLSFTVDVNLEQVRNKVSFKTESVCFDPLYTLFSSVSVSSPVYPMVRVVWNNTAGVFSGASLQIGLPLMTLSDQMIIEDMSTTESGWILDRTGEFVTGSTPTPVSPRDTSFTLPNGTSTWTSGGAISFSETFVPDFDDGYLVYSGSAVTMSDINTTDSTSGLFNVVLPVYYPIKSIRSLVVTLVNAASTTTYDIEIPLTGLNSTTRTGRYVFGTSTGALLEITATLVQGAGGAITLSLNLPDVSLSIWTVTPATMTDVIRYVRAKV